MNILRFAIGIYPERIGGTEMNVARISEGQARRGHRVEVHVPRPPARDGITTPVPTRLFDVRTFASTVEIFGNPLSFAPLRCIRSRAEATDVVHAHSHLFFGSNVAAYACRRAGLPFVLTSEGIYSQTAPQAVQGLFMRTVAAYTFSAARLVLCHSQCEADDLAKLGIAKEKLRVITQGIDADFFTPQPRAARQDLALLWVGRHAPGKGADVALRTLRQLRDEGIDASLTLLGEGPQRTSAEALADALGLKSHVEFIGFVEEARLRDVYAGADLLLLPSVSEGMSRTVLEALACGTPAIASSIPQLEMFLEDCGAVAQARTPEAFATAVKTLAEQDLEELGQRGRKKVVAHHSWERTHDDIEQAFSELLD